MGRVIFRRVFDLHVLILDIQDTTRSAGNYKRFTVFAEMCMSALSGESTSLKVDIQETRKACYFILNYAVAFDNISYSLPLHCGEYNERYAQEVKQLREETGVSIMQCKRALEEAGGDMDAARKVLAEKSAAAAEKKADRELGAGVIASYVHGNGTAGASTSRSVDSSTGDRCVSPSYQL